MEETIMPIPASMFHQLNTAAAILDSLEDEGVADWSGYGPALARAMDLMEEWHNPPIDE